MTTEAGRKRKTYLVGLLDDATRVVPFAAFTLSETTAAHRLGVAELELRVESMIEDGPHAAVRGGADREGATTRGFQPLLAIALTETKDSHNTGRKNENPLVRERVFEHLAAPLAAAAGLGVSSS